jgi:hypothetical protein
MTLAQVVGVGQGPPPQVLEFGDPLLQFGDPGLQRAASAVPPLPAVVSGSAAGPAGSPPGTG